MPYEIDPKAWRSIFAVPSVLVDKHLKLAGAVQLKVLLWMLRHADESPDMTAVSKALGISAPDASDAMLYWQECGLVIKGENSIPDHFEAADSQKTPSSKLPDPVSPVTSSQLAHPSGAAGKTEKVLSRPRKADNAFVAKRMKENSEIAFLMQEAQQIMGRLINNGESATLLMIHDEFGLPIDVILMLLNYVASIGKANMRYIEKTAMNWADEEIFTHDKAEEKLRQLDEAARSWRLVESILGTSHRTPTKSENEMACRWVQEWKFTREMIQEAYERCVNQTGKINLRYMQKILERWKAEGITTLSQAMQEQTRNTEKKAKEKTSYDIDSFENSGAFDAFNLDDYLKR